MTNDALIKVIAERWISHERVQLRLGEKSATFSVWVDGEGWRTIHRLARREDRFPVQGLSGELRSWLLDTMQLQACVSVPPERLDEVLARPAVPRACMPRRSRRAA